MTERNRECKEKKRKRIQDGHSGCMFVNNDVTEFLSAIRLVVNKENIELQFCV